MAERLDSTTNPNFSRGITAVEIPELGSKKSGKVRDIWELEDGRRVMITTDRLSAFDHIICSVPGKGQVLNLLSAVWMRMCEDIIGHHILSVPHPNVVVAKQAIATLPIEVVLRRYMAKSSTSTSVYYNYMKGRRTIYGIKFPNGLVANQEFAQTIVTPTTKAGEGLHDMELTDDEAEGIVDVVLGKRFGKGLWHEAREAAKAIFDLGYDYCKQRGLILVDTKYEFGIDEDGKLMLIDEVHTPDSSRYWLADSYHDRLGKGMSPQNFDKEIIRKWLADQGYRGEGQVPALPTELIDQVAKAYTIPYQMLTGIAAAKPERDIEEIRKVVLAAV